MGPRDMLGKLVKRNYPIPMLRIETSHSIQKLWPFCPRKINPIQESPTITLNYINTQYKIITV